MPNPLELLESDRERARRAGDALVDRCFLATVRADGQPSIRTLVLRELSQRLALFCNTHSPKYAQAVTTQSIEVLTWYASIGIQYRLRAKVEPIPAAEVHAQWTAKPENSRRVDQLYASYPQSSPIESYEQLKDLVRTEPLRSTAPPTVGGLYLNVYEVDRLNLETPDGVHHRQLYVYANQAWESSTLMP